MPVLFHAIGVKNPQENLATLTIETLLGPVRGGLYVPRLNFKPFHIAISEGSLVAVGMSSIATDMKRYRKCLI